MLGAALIPLILLFTLFAAAGLAAVPQARSTITPVAVSRAADRESSGASIRAEGQREGGERISENSVLRPGESIIVTARDFEPGNQVSIRLSGVQHSTGTDFADSTGTVRFIYRLPTQMHAGQYRVLVQGATTPHDAAGAGSGNVITTVPQFALLAFIVG